MQCHLQRAGVRAQIIANGQADHGGPGAGQREHVGDPSENVGIGARVGPHDDEVRARRDIFFIMSLRHAVNSGSV
jgi:hypothetical protein